MQANIVRILRKPEVLSLRGRSNSSHYADISAGLYTQPVPIGVQSVGWPENEVAALNAARIAGKSQAEIKQLVVALHAARKAGAA